MIEKHILGWECLARSVGIHAYVALPRSVNFPFLTFNLIWLISAGYTLALSYLIVHLLRTPEDRSSKLLNSQPLRPLLHVAVRTSSLSK
jgi:hypothetical protein